jgi:hypothetical protein
MTGRFYFRLTTSGNLLGEFSNNGMDGNDAESANRIGVISNSFLGQFDATWYEENQAQHLILHIIAKPNTTNIFSLTWSDSRNQIRFWGEGFIVDGLLIGDYRDRPNP